MGLHFRGNSNNNCKKQISYHINIRIKLRLTDLTEPFPRLDFRAGDWRWELKKLLH